MSLITRYSPLALTLLAFLLRAYKLDAQSYWIDEAWTVYFAHLTPAELWHLLQTTEIMPPLYHPSTIYYVKLFGDSEYALRFYSLVFGVMAVPFTFRLGKDLGDTRLGQIAALLLAVAPFQIWYSQDARMYSMLTAASVMSMWGFVNVWRRGGWRWWLVYIIGTLWAINTHYHGAVLIGIQGLFLLLTWQRHWRGYLRWGAALLLMLALLVPWLAFGGNLLQSYRNWIEQPTLTQTFLRSAIAYSLNELVPHDQAILLIPSFVVLYLLGLVTASRRRWGAWRGWEMLALLACYTIAPLIAAWLYGLLRTPVYLERYMILVQVGYLLTIAVGLLAIADLHMAHYTLRIFGDKFTMRLSQILAALLLALLIGINGWVLQHYYTDPTYARPNWRGVAQTIANFELPGDAVLLTGDGGENAFNFYYRGTVPVRYDFNLLPPLHPDYKKGHPGPEAVPQIMANLAAQYRRLWFTPYGVEVDQLIESWLRENSYPAWQQWLGRKRLALYQTQAQLAPPQPLNAHFADAAGLGPELVSAALPAGPVAAGDTLPLELTWQTETSLAADYQLSLRLINQQGDLFAQSDWPPLPPAARWTPRQPLTDRRSLWIPADVPPGEFQLQLVLYNPANGQSLGQPLTIPDVAVAPAQITPPPESLSIPNFQQPGNSKLNTQNLKLLGYALPAEIQPGQEMWLWLYWQAQTPLSPNLWLNVTLHSASEVVTTSTPLAESLGSLESWQPGQVRRAVYHLPTSPRLQGDTVRVDVSLETPTGQSNPIPVGSVKLKQRVRQFTPPLPATTANVAFGNPPLLTLLGFNQAGDNSKLTPALRAGISDPQNLKLVLYWRAEAEMETNYTVFVQLLNGAGQVVAQVDAQPQQGSAPTTTWLPGEYVTDPYTLNLPPDLPPGQYRLIAGLYNPASGARLAASSGADFVELAPVTVR